MLVIFSMISISIYPFFIGLVNKIEMPKKTPKNVTHFNVFQHRKGKQTAVMLVIFAMISISFNYFFIGLVNEIEMPKRVFEKCNSFLCFPTSKR